MMPQLLLTLILTAGARQPDEFHGDGQSEVLTALDRGYIYYWRE